MKISEVASKTDKQFHEDLKTSVGLTLKKFGNNILSAAGNKSEIGIKAEPIIPKACSIPWV